MMRSITACFAPSPIASIAITEATPMTMPSNVSTERNTLARSARSAMRAASSTSPMGESAPRLAVQLSAGESAVGGRARRGRPRCRRP